MMRSPLREERPLLGAIPLPDPFRRLTSTVSSHSLSSPLQPLPFSPPPPLAAQRPSVIKRAGREDRSKLQLQADILKFHGNILTHTGDTNTLSKYLFENKNFKCKYM